MLALPFALSLSLFLAYNFVDQFVAKLQRATVQLLQAICAVFSAHCALQQLLLGQHFGVLLCVQRRHIPRLAYG